MSANSHSHIKKDTLLGALSLILRGGEVTRADIARECGVSVMTAGKIADAFLELGIVEQRKSEKKLPGRRASVIAPKRSKFAAVYDVSRSEKEFAIVDGFGNSFGHACSDTVHALFAASAKEITAFDKKDELIGTCLIRDDGDASRIFEKTFRCAPDITISPLSTRETAMRHLYGSRAVGVYIGLAQKTRGFVFDAGKAVGGRECDFGEMLTFKGVRFDEAVKSGGAASALGSVINNLNSLLAPDIVCVESEFAIPRRFELELAKLFPTIEFRRGTSLSLLGASLALRDMRIRELLLSQTNGK